MDLKSPRHGQIEYLSEGFILHWDEAGLGIEVIDYHARTLRLAWKDVQALAVRAYGERTSGRSRPS